MNDKAAHPCRRCGQCCQKGGPGLHTQDRHLVESGRIPARCLFTIRRGEMARDNVAGTLVPLEQEIVKIKGRGGCWTCRYYHEKSQGCGIYDHRPVECRALNCRDTRRIEALYDRDRLTRRVLLAKVQGLWELVVEHERRCGYDGLKALVAAGSIDGRLRREAAILEIMRYDAQLRRLTAEKGGLDPRMLDFIFGRSLVDTIKMFDLAVVKVQGQYRLVVQPPTAPQKGLTWRNR